MAGAVGAVVGAAQWPSFCCDLACASGYGVDLWTCTMQGELMRERLRRTLCATLLLGATVTGCGSGGDSKVGTPAVSVGTTAAPTASATPDPQAAQKAAVLKAYRQMTTAQAAAYRTASEKEADLQRYATLEALGKIRLDLARMKEAGMVVRGEVGHDPKVTSLDLNAQTPKATLSDCIDLSKYQTYDLRAKKVIPLPTAQPLRYVATAKAERWSGRWMVTDIDTQGGSAC
ncbi:hypothetical protein [Streptomyces sp. NPDC056820]